MRKGARSLSLFKFLKKLEMLKIWIKSSDSTQFGRPLCLEYKKRKTTELNSPNKSKYIQRSNSKAKIRYNASQTMFNGKCVNQ